MMNQAANGSMEAAGLMKRKLPVKKVTRYKNGKSNVIRQCKEIKSR